MIYGPNFNCTQIPEDAARLFAPRLDQHFRGVTINRTADWLLAGVCSTTHELNAMLLQADNGLRKFHTVAQRNWIAVYIGYK